MLAETIAHQLEKENSAIRITARKVVKLINQGIELTREIARGLYSSELDGDGLFSALESLSRSASVGRVTCEFEHSGKPPRSNELATQLYWVAREAVTNALKHAEPRNVRIQLQTTDDYLRLKVEDDGRGLRQDAMRDGIGLKVPTTEKGFGLRNLLVACRKAISDRKICKGKLFHRLQLITFCII
jgi:two-component system CheB/CheR fusion protein